MKRNTGHVQAAQKQRLRQKGVIQSKQRENHLAVAIHAGIIHNFMEIKDGRLGINASHGCVRLALSNAKWIYDNIPRGTKVVIY